MKKGYFVLLALLLGACNAANDNGLEIQNLRIRPPLPGTEAAVAYFTVVNRGRADVQISGVSSSEFAGAEIHVSLLEDGISKMRRVEVLPVAGRSTVEFKPGSYHVMLFRPQPDLVPGVEVSISVRYGDNSEVTAAAAYGAGF